MAKDTRSRQRSLKAQIARDAVSEAISYFERTGAYRAEDLRRVLGDPRDHAELKGDLSLKLASWTTSR